MAQSSHTRGSDPVSDLKDKASDQLSKVTGQVEGMANRVSEQRREATERMGEVAGNLKGAVDSPSRTSRWPPWRSPLRWALCLAPFGNRKSPCLQA